MYRMVILKASTQPSTHAQPPHSIWQGVLFSLQLFQSWDVRVARYVHLLYAHLQ